MTWGLPALNFILMSKTKFDVRVGQAIEWIEKISLILVAILVLGAIIAEIGIVIERQEILLADILLIFIYSEVLLMVGLFYSSSEIPIAYPLFIAITALARLIVLQGKEMDPINIFYEAISIFVLSLAIFVLGYSKKTRFSLKTVVEEQKKREN